MIKKKKIYCKHYLFKSCHCGKITLEVDGYIQKCMVSEDYTKCKGGEPEDQK